MLTIKEDYRVKTLIKFSNKLSPNSLIQYKHRFNLLNQLIKIIVLIWIFKELILTKKNPKSEKDLWIVKIELFLICQIRFKKLMSIVKKCL